MAPRTRLPQHVWSMLCLAGLLLAGEVRTLHSQVTPADTAAVLLGAARRAHDEGNRQLARSILQLIVRHYGGTTAATEAESQLGEWRQAADSTSGRVELIVWGTTYGAWLGIGLPLAAGIEDPEPFGAGILLGTSLGFFGTRAFAQHLPISLGQAKIIRFASMWGAWQGIGWQEVFDIGDHTQRYCDPLGGPCVDYPVDSDLAPITVSLVGSLAGLTTGFALARNVSISPSTAAIVEFSGYWATWYGVAGAVLLGWEEDDLLTSALLAGNAGVLAAVAAAPGIDMSVGRARLISVTGIAGVIAGLGLDLLLNVDDEKTAIAIPMATSFAGLALGVSWTRNYGARDQDDLRDGNALLELGDGRPRLGLPVPQPAALPSSFDGWRVRREPGLKLTLARATF